MSGVWRVRVRASVSAVILVNVTGLACRPEAPAEPPPAGPPPVVLVGVDGLEWSVLLPLLREGRLPAMAGLMQRGTFGLLKTIRPTLSPVIWTSIATGKTPAEHGILNFVKPFKPEGKLELNTSLDRKTKAIWNIAGDYDRRVAVVGWWMTFPVEEVNGVMVAQTNTAAQFDTSFGKNVWKGSLRQGIPGQVHPPERQAGVMSLLAEVEAGLPELTKRIFGRFDSPLSVLGQRLWDNCQWSFRADATYLRIAEELLGEAEPYDLMCVYFGGPDVVGHRFWRYTYPDLYKNPPPPEQAANLGNVIDDYYVYVDGVLAKLVAAAGTSARLILVSDHGMRAVNTDGEFDPDDPPQNVNSGHHLTGEPGVIIAAGPGIARMKLPRGPARLERYDLRRVASVLDIAPTVLALMGIPLGEDFAGTVSEALIVPQFLADNPVTRVPTHDSQEWLQSRRTGSSQVPGADERIEQLRSLGYIEGD